MDANLKTFIAASGSSDGSSPESPTFTPSQKHNADDPVSWQTVSGIAAAVVLVILVVFVLACIYKKNNVSPA